MKKKLFLFSTAGVAAGLVYALEINRRKRHAGRETQSNGESSANGKPSAISDGQATDLANRGTSMTRTGNEQSLEPQPEAHQLDDRGTNQAEATQILKEIRDNAFEASDEKLALALGRPTEEIEQWFNGDGLIDGDVVLKARALATHRGVEIE